MPLSEARAKIIRENIATAGAELEGKLPPSPHHARRNPYAHLYKCIKNKMGKSYKECNDDDFEQIIELIDYCRQNPF